MRKEHKKNNTVLVEINKRFPSTMHFFFIIFHLFSFTIPPAIDNTKDANNHCVGGTKADDAAAIRTAKIMMAVITKTTTETTTIITKNISNNVRNSNNTATAVVTNTGIKTIITATVLTTMITPTS